MNQIDVAEAVPAEGKSLPSNQSHGVLNRREGSQSLSRASEASYGKVQLKEAQSAKVHKQEHQVSSTKSPGGFAKAWKGKKEQQPLNRL